MKFKGLSPEIAINSNEEIFGRDDFSNGIISLFASSDDPLVIALDEPWGTGKTVFAKRLERQCRSAGISAVYFDAFKHDYEPNAFLALTATLLAHLPEKEKRRAELKEKAIAVGRALGKAGLKATVRLATANTLRFADLEDGAAEIASELVNQTIAEVDALIERRLSERALEEAAFDRFRETLAAVANAPFSDDDDAGKGLVFIIDELDRCKPDYAIDVLESAKHFFSAQKVHFFICCDYRQLVAAVESRYGVRGFGYEYLEKFVDARVTFPIQEKNQRERSLRSFIRNTIKPMPPDNEEGKAWDGLIEFIITESRKRDYTLRRIEKIATQYALCMKFTKKEQFRIGAVVYVLCDLKVSNPNLFQKAKNGTLSWIEIRDHFQFHDDDNNWFVRWLRYFYDKSIDLSSKEWNSLSSSLWTYNLDSPGETAQYLANGVVDRISVS